MAEKSVIIERPHDDLDDSTYHEWVDVWLPEHEEEHGPRLQRRDRLGRRNHGSIGWVRWCCNNLQCSGVLLVNPNAISEHVNTLASSAPSPAPTGQPQREDA